MNSTAQAFPPISDLPKHEEAIITQSHVIANLQQYYLPEGHSNLEFTQNSILFARHFKALSDSLTKLTNYEVYQIGKELGIREFRAFYLSLVPKNSLLFVNDWKLALRNWWRYSNLSTYGEFNLDLIYKQHNYLFVTLVKAQTNTKVDINLKPICPLIAGLLAAFFSGFVGSKFEVIEPHCHKVEDKNCTFLVSNGEYINATKFWQTIDRIN